MRNKATDEKKSIWNTLNDETFDEIQINSGTKNKLIIFKEIIKNLIKSDNNIFETAELLIETTGLVRKLKDDPTDENINRLENISELFNSLKLFSLKKNNNSLADFINEISRDDGICVCVFSLEISYQRLFILFSRIKSEYQEAQ